MRQGRSDYGLAREYGGRKSLRAVAAAAIATAAFSCAAHQPQRYGTQGRCNAEHRFEPREMEDPANVDERRKAMDLPPLREYIEFATRHLCVK